MIKSLFAAQFCYNICHALHDSLIAIWVQPQNRDSFITHLVSFYSLIASHTSSSSPNSKRMECLIVQNKILQNFEKAGGCNPGWKLSANYSFIGIITKSFKQAGNLIFHFLSTIQRRTSVSISILLPSAQKKKITKSI